MEETSSYFGDDKTRYAASIAARTVYVDNDVATTISSSWKKNRIDSTVSLNARTKAMLLTTVY